MDGEKKPADEQVAKNEEENKDASKTDPGTESANTPTNHSKTEDQKESSTDKEAEVSLIRVFTTTKFPSL